MTIPGRVEAACLLLSLDPPPWFVRHACAVAEIASWLATRTTARGGRVDLRLVEAAALLHDVDKVVPAGDPARALPHGDGSASWLTRAGHGELATTVAAHPVARFGDAARFEAWASVASVDERIVAYADKRAGQRLETMAARFGSWRLRYPPATGRAGDTAWDEATFAAVRSRAAWLEADVCQLAGVAPGDVRRLAWTARALRRARRSMPGGLPR